MHLQQITTPFICEPPSSGIGPGRMTAATDVYCDRDTWEYSFMYDMGRVFICGVFVIIALYVWLIDYAFYWQFGNRVRESMPFPVAIVEVTAFAMRGYVNVVRRNLDLRVIALRGFNIKPSEIKRREAVWMIEENMRKYHGRIIFPEYNEFADES